MQLSKNQKIILLIGILLIIAALSYLIYVLLNKKKEGFSNYNHKPDIPLIFNETPFKPECCPNTYTNSVGCACMTLQQYNYLNDRGGNNVPYSEY
jgi:hypothetical protein